MLYILFCLLFIMALMAYLLAQKDAMSPSFILTALFLFCTIFAIVGNIKWGVSFSADAVMAIVLGLLAIQFGELTARQIKRKSYYIKIKNTVAKSISNREYIHVSNRLLFFIILVNTVIFILYFRRLVDMASSIGYSGDRLIYYVRIATISLDIKFGAFFTITLGIITASGYVCTYILIHNYFVKNHKKSKLKGILLLFPIIISLIVRALSGARNGFIEFLVVAISIFVFCYPKKNNRIRLGKILPLGCLAIFVFLIIFSQLGHMTGKIGSNVFDAIMLYAGSSIVGLSMWLENYTPSTLLGEESFWGLRYLINKFFPAVECNRDSHFLEYVFFDNGATTNIYTGFRSYIADFGWVGMVVICFFIGFIYSISYLKVSRKPKPLTVILYSFFFYYFIYTLFTPAVTSSLFTSSQMLGVFWICVICHIMIGKKGVQHTYEQ